MSVNCPLAVLGAGLFAHKVHQVRCSGGWRSIFYQARCRLDVNRTFCSDGQWFHLNWKAAAVEGPA